MNNSQGDPAPSQLENTPKSKTKGNSKKPDLMTSLPAGGTAGDPAAGSNVSHGMQQWLDQDARDDPWSGVRYMVGNPPKVDKDISEQSKKGGEHGPS
ncbi:MAG: hypothetical protein Q9187_000740 [Circinaria calcarea]